MPVIGFLGSDGGPFIDYIKTRNYISAVDGGAFGSALRNNAAVRYLVTQFGKI